jgi:4'-phosphopantetheinyl transferase
LPEDTVWPQDARRVPLPVGGLHWSISHKPGWAAAVISRGLVGIDIEIIRPRLHSGLLDRLADPAEWTIAGGRTWDTFFQIWTAKEAVLKAVGQGIAGLGDCRVVELYPAAQTRLEHQGVEWTVDHLRTASGIAGVTRCSPGLIWHSGPAESSDIMDVQSGPVREIV